MCTERRGMHLIPQRSKIMVSTSKIALFIDGANLYATAKTLGFDIDYTGLLSEFQNRGTLLRAFYYTAIVKEQEFSSIRPLIDWLDYNGYTVVTKPTKEFIDADGRRKVKGNMDNRACGRCHGARRVHRPDGVVLGRRRLPAPWSKPSSAAACGSP